ncbi:hypothetical protein KL935_001492 [Ogataea polymorpha]|uniref:Septin-type G domain-containing protein n=1 Tax=Ogataea polymorpha TaxID=460523 RepID=A0A9P8P0Z3_9ASCO|nr:hypothetical protein KL936_001523 [Ogataea polymorpha]KAG7894933.1 hypothetical protein KL908_001283 [Ogataea polymorpha]KAG7902584.1 hypothetical protein KL935_001492 [Ogataea polymorpha]KAG7911428.1 hypothetical protein KL906_000749 [Ogataea polymorpha]KAG7912739.1 hypothetical protein KL907_000941 [Ogataea polymorpha]
MAAQVDQLTDKRVISSIDLFSAPSAPLTGENIDIDVAATNGDISAPLEPRNAPSTSSTSTLLKDEEYPTHYNMESAIANMYPGDVGLACLPVLKRLHALKKGAHFTIMMVGESGVGKTSFINTLFDTVVTEPTTRLGGSPNKTTEIVSHKIELVEDNFLLRLNVIDTPGFGDYIDNRYCWYPIVRYIDERYRRAVYQENQPDRTKTSHSEVHVCLYFIVPSATGLTQVDIEAMKNLSTRVNLVPVISKADAFTVDEINAFKQRVRKSLKEHEISICELFDKTGAANLIGEMPFCVLNSQGSFPNAKGQLVRGRQYKWGLAEVDNPAHCDFVKLREFLMGTNMADLISSTENYYENYRRDFMRYRLGKAMEMTISPEELAALNVENENGETIVPDNKGSWKTVQVEDGQTHPNIQQVIESKPSVGVLKMLNTLNLRETERELVEMNPAYLDSEKTMKKRFTEIVQAQNQKFKDWKRALFERQDKFNKDIEQIHKRLVALQDEIKTIDER